MWSRTASTCACTVATASAPVSRWSTSTVRFPLFQTSANLSGEPAPSVFEGVVPEVRELVDLAIDGGRLTGLPSTVVDLTNYDEHGKWEILREGGMSRGDLIAALGR